MKSSHLLVALSAGLMLSGCAGKLYDHLPTGAAAYRIAPSIDQAVSPTKYTINPGDELSFAVFDEPDLAIPKVVVDDAGNVQLPLVGSVHVAELSPAEASHEISLLYGKRYLKDPQVTLSVTTPVPHMASVEGEVNQAGAFVIGQDTTLLSVIAMAHSTTKIAALTEVVIFRTRDGQRMAGRFNLGRIRAGIDPDPQILAGDDVVVGLSHGKSLYRDFIQAAPLFNIFYRL